MSDILYRVKFSQIEQSTCVGVKMNSNILEGIGVVEAFSKEGTFSRSWFLLEMFRLQY